MTDDRSGPTDSENDQRGESTTRRPSASSPGDDWTRGWTVWVVLGVLGLAFLAIPWGLIALPTIQESIRVAGLSFRDAYLVVPLVPAIGLGALGVWLAVRSA